MTAPTRTPLTLITGSLGSGKTTLLRHILNAVKGRLAILVNEFGEIAIDSRIVRGKHIEIAELGGGCVCCSLLGEFEAAVEEILESVKPDIIMVETTGVAEPDSLAFDIQESLPRVRLDGIITVVDADGLIKFPQLGRTTRLQIEEGDLLLLNKVDLVGEEELSKLEEKLRQVNDRAPIVRTERCRVDPDLLFGLGRQRKLTRPRHTHQPQFDSLSCRLSGSLDREAFESFVRQLAPDVYRAKGFLRFPEGPFLFNYVSGRWELEPFESEENVLVFIGSHLKDKRQTLVSGLRRCEIHS